MINSRLNLNSFLHFGYFLNYHNKNYSLDFSKINREKYIDVSEEDLIKIGGKIFKEVVQEIFDSRQKQVVPLSGGMDSRAILAMLLELTDASSIYTYTFGVPGTYDFDIGNYLAKKYGTKHTIYDLSKHEYKLEELLDISNRIDYQSPLFLHAPVWDLDRKFGDGIIWSGANAGAVVGSFYMKNSSKTYKEAQIRFISKANFVKSIKLVNVDLSEFTSLMDKNSFSPDLLTYDEQVYFKERSIKHLAPHVLMKGFTYKLPFVNNEFMNFMLSVPRKYRLGKRLYKKIMFNIFPDIFSLRSESTYGLTSETSNWILYMKRSQLKVMKILRKKFPFINWGVSPTVNYMDWDKAIRDKNDIKQIIGSQVKDLSARGIVDWIDIDKIWLNHQRKNANYADALMVLASLEVHLKNQKNI